MRRIRISTGIGAKTGLTVHYIRHFCRMIVLGCALLVPVANADPWIEVGRSGLRHDIQVLADAGVIKSPVFSWPLSWGDIAPQLHATENLTPYQLAALRRVRRDAGMAMSTGGINLYGRASFAENPIEIRSFENTPRGDAEVEVGASWTGNRFAVRGRLTWVDDPADGKEWRADGSYVAMALGNWMLAGTMQDRWWGPGWQSSLVLSNNARPIPALTLERNSTHPWETKWLSWIGPWDFSMIWGFLESDRAVPDSKFFGMRFDFRPLEQLEIGLSRTALWCGDGRPCDLDTFIDLLLGNDNVGVNTTADDEPGDQLGGFDIRWSGQIKSFPYSLYGQFIGEDVNDFFPTKWLGQIGTETWGDWSGLGSYRLFLEWADTACGFKLYNSLRGDSEDTEANCAYNHSVYKTGYRYRGRSIGHTFDNDASIFTLGSMLIDHQNNTWLLNFDYGNLNRIGAPDSRNTVAQVKTRLRTAELSYRRAIVLGEIFTGVGYDYRKNTVTDESDGDFQFYLQWSVDY